MRRRSAPDTADIQHRPPVPGVPGGLLLEDDDEMSEQMYVTVMVLGVVFLVFLGAIAGLKADKLLNRRGRKP